MRGGEKTSGTLGERSVAGWLSDRRGGVLSINCSAGGIERVFTGGCEEGASADGCEESSSDWRGGGCEEGASADGCEESSSDWRGGGCEESSSGVSLCDSKPSRISLVTRRFSAATALSLTALLLGYK